MRINRTVLVPTVGLCRECGNKALCFGSGFCIGCMRDAYESVIVGRRRDPPPPIIVESPRPDPEYRVVLESLGVYTTHKPKCAGWGDFPQINRSCDCGLAGLRERAQALLEGLER